MSSNESDPRRDPAFLRAMNEAGRRLYDRAIFRAFAPREAELAEHNARMEAGCLLCFSAVPGRVCPDCYVCIACSPGCDECAPLRP